MGGILTWQILGVLGVGAIALVLLFAPVLQADDPPELLATEAMIIAGEYMASEYGSSGCSFAEFDETRAVWEVSCSYDDPLLCESEGHSVSCGPEARISNPVLVDDKSARAYEPR